MLRAVQHRVIIITYLKCREIIHFSQMVVLILLAVSATVASAGCGPDIGFNADLRLNNNVNKAAIWTEGEPHKSCRRQ